MKTSINRRHSTTGTILLALIALVVIGFVLYFGGKVIYKLMHWNIDPNRGNQDPENDSAVAEVQRVMEADPTAYLSVSIPSISGLSSARLPVKMLACEWEYQVWSSTNLADWELSPLDWEDAMALVRTAAETNGVSNQPALFYKLTVCPK